MRTLLQARTDASITRIRPNHITRGGIVVEVCEEQAAVMFTMMRAVAAAVTLLQMPGVLIPKAHAQTRRRRARQRDYNAIDSTIEALELLTRGQMASFCG